MYVQGISSSDEDAFDDDASAYSSSGNDSDIVRAISADIVMDGESNRCLGSRVAQEAYLEIEYIRNVLSVSGTLKYADSGTA